MSVPPFSIRTLVETALVFGSVLLLALFYLNIQEPASLAPGFDWDEKQYRLMAGQFRAGETVSADAPEVYRIGTPFIASLLPFEDLTDAFFFLEMTAAILAIMLLYFWLRLHLQSLILPILFVGLSVTTLWGPIRATTFHLHGIEGSSFLLIMIGYLSLYFFDRSGKLQWVALLCLVSAAGGAVREACLLPALALPFADNPLRKTMFSDLPTLARTFFAADRLILFLPLVCGLLSIISVRALVTPADSWNYLNMIAWGFSDIGPLRYITSFFNALGPVPIVVLFAAGFTSSFLKCHQMFAIVLVAFLFISWAALGDERYFVWVMPIIFVMTGSVLEQHFDVIRRWPIMLTVVVFELIAVRALFPLPPHAPKIQKSIPEEALARYLPDGWAMSEMNAYTAEPKSVLVAVGLSLLMAGILWLLMRRTAKPFAMGHKTKHGDNQSESSTRIPLSSNTFDRGEIAAVNAVMESGRLTMGDGCREFEQKFADYLGVKHAIFVNSGSSANLLAVFAIASQKNSEHRQLESGCEVIVPAVTWPTTVWPVIQAGAIPVFVDCDPTSLQMQTSAIEAAITPKTRAIIPTHVMGNACDMGAVMEIAAQHDLWVIEDTCEALGAKSGGRFAGAIGDLGTFSFYFSHHISTIEGGMVVTSNDSMADLLRSMRSHGWTKDMTNHLALAKTAPDIDPRFLFVNPGFNVRPTEIGAALGLKQLTRLPKFNSARTQISAQWNQAFEPLVKRGEMDFMRPSHEADPVHFAYPILCKDHQTRNRLRDHLDENGIENRPIIAGNITNQPAFSDTEFRRSADLPGADKIADLGLYWALDPMMEQSDIDFVEKCVSEFFEA